MERGNLFFQHNCERPDRPPHTPGTHHVKVAASSLRKGAVVELDDKLYVVLTVDNIHPGKGT
ncbi:elongation factor P, partial [bacterium]|nr:elongation factor P [bacterium]